jgi:hypothetical protein
VTKPVGNFSPVTVLPDGSAFAVASFPLPKGHWLYAGHTNVPPMPWRIGEGGTRSEMADKVRAAARYAVRSATLNGKDLGFDPDALVQNMVVGMLGYWTHDGTTEDKWAMPDPVPPLVEG